MQVKSRAEAEAETRARLAEAVAAVGEGEPDPAPQIGPAPCSSPLGESGEGGYFHISAFSHVTVPVERHRPILERLRDEWRAKGYEVRSFRDLPGTPGGAELDVSNPADGFQITWSSSADGVWIALIVMSPCVRSPDGEYPG